MDNLLRGLEAILGLGKLVGKSATGVSNPLQDPIDEPCFGWYEEMNLHCPHIDHEFAAWTLLAVSGGPSNRCISPKTPKS
jgi:hypothetical protein